MASIGPLDGASPGGSTSHVFGANRSRISLVPRPCPWTPAEIDGRTLSPASARSLHIRPAEVHPVKPGRSDSASKEPTMAVFRTRKVLCVALLGLWTVAFL